MTKYVCNDCDHVVMSPEKDRAPCSIKWSDGHECYFIKEKESDNVKATKRNDKG